MIRRTLQGGLVAVVAMFALVPTAAVALEGDHATPAPVVATVPHRSHVLLPFPARHVPARHRARRSTRYHHHVRHVRHIRHVRRATWSAYHRRTTHVVGRVATRHAALNVRSGPGTGYRVIGHRRLHGRLLLACGKHGSYVYGNRHWYRLANGKGYVSARYVRTRVAVPWC